jgi:SAM-dependent methyltransferase
MDVSQTVVDRYNEAAEKTSFTPAQMRAVRADLVSGDGLDQVDVDGNEEFSNFDIAIVSMALHHVDDHQGLLSKMAERLRPDGTLVVVDWSPFAPGTEPPDLVMPPHLGHRLDFDKEYIAGCFVGAGCTPSSFRYVLLTEDSHMPESATKVKGGLIKRAFLALGKKGTDE